MPEISRFHEIVIRIFFEAGRHQLPHLHAVYGEHLASFSIDPPALLAGTMPRRQMHLILAWIELHQDELFPTGSWPDTSFRLTGYGDWNEVKMITEYTLHRVTNFVYVRDYVLKVTFEDGLERTVDLEPILVGPIFGALRDRSLFKQVTLDRDFGALEWPNGADIDPAVLHDWPNHVDAIVAQRQQLLAVPA